MFVMRSCLPFPSIVSDTTCQRVLSGRVRPKGCVSLPGGLILACVGHMQRSRYVEIFLYHSRVSKRSDFPHLEPISHKNIVRIIIRIKIQEQTKNHLTLVGHALPNVVTYSSRDSHVRVPCVRGFCKRGSQVKVSDLIVGQSVQFSLDKGSNRVGQWVADRFGSKYVGRISIVEGGVSSSGWRHVAPRHACCIILLGTRWVSSF